MSQTTLIDTAGKVDWEYKEWPGPARSKITGISASKTISIASLKSITISTRTNGYAMLWDGGQDGTGYSTCSSNVTITIRQNNASGAVIATNANVSEATLNNLRAQGVTNIYVVASSPSATGGWDSYQHGGNYTWIYNTKPAAKVVATLYDTVPVTLDGATATYVALDGTTASHVKFDGATVY